MKQKTCLQLSFLLLAISVALGAVGAHLLEKNLAPKNLATFQTGVKYLTYHSLALLIFSSSSELFSKLTWSKRLFFVGLVFFCGNCLIYALTSVKVFALLVPIGGFAFILGWLVGFFEIKDYSPSISK